MNRVRRFRRSESGIAVTEYGLLLALVALLLIGVVVIFGGDIGSWFAAKTGRSQRSEALLGCRHNRAPPRDHRRGMAPLGGSRSGRSSPRRRS
jgi:Flp pilus assembly pilin Flp